VVAPSAYYFIPRPRPRNSASGRCLYRIPVRLSGPDWGRIVIEDGCNVQETAPATVFPGVTVLEERMSAIGQRRHHTGATIGPVNCLIG